ncbi:MAG TPA: efflux RND transporter periplasmic adaptor subunit [Candidatus Nitrosopolaris sp.]|nr:efflux RND transporter periplasmic adaptor subunit [Candidatus Nitrosopolaris sp.]
MPKDRHPMHHHWIACFLLALAPACGRHDLGDRPAAAADRKLTPAQLSFLKFAPVAEAEAGAIADLSGTIEFDEERTARLNAPVAGRVVELLVQVGDRVVADQPLVALDSPEVKAAQVDYVRAEADAELARTSAERAERLRAARAIAEKDFVQAQQELRKAEADFERARAQLERLRVAPGERSSRYFLRAPFAGTIVERKALVGTEIAADSPEPLVVVSDLSRVRVIVRLPERQLSLVEAGQAAAIHVDAYPQDFPGEVVAVGDVIDEATRTVLVRCTVPNPDHLLKPAMFARVQVKAPAGRRIATVPLSALLSDGRHFRVLVRQADGQLDTRPVELGAEVGGAVQVLSGLQVGEEVVVEGALFAARQLSSS